MTYWAVKPVGRDDAIRIEKAVRADDAVRLAFGRSWPDNHPLIYNEVGKWLAKDLKRLGVVQSDKKRMTALRDPKDWIDPFEWAKARKPAYDAHIARAARAAASSK